MQVTKPIILLILFCLTIGHISFAQVSTADSNPWNFVLKSSIPLVELKERQIVPKKYKTVQVDLNQLKSILEKAPTRFSPEAQQTQVMFSLPMPDGQVQQFQIEEASVMHPKLAERYPNIKSYSGKGIDDPSASVRFDLTPHGFHAMVLTGRSSTCLLYTSPSPRDQRGSRMPSSA